MYSVFIVCGGTVADTMEKNTMSESPQKTLLCFLIDDTKDIPVLPALAEQACEWHVFRTLSELRRSEVYKTRPADVVVFDYYLTHGATGRDAMEIILNKYEREDWPLPRAVFGSSDPERNTYLRKLWLSYDGETLDSEEKKPVVHVEQAPRKASGVAAHFRRNKTKSHAR